MSPLGFLGWQKCLDCEHREQINYDTPSLERAQMLQRSMPKFDRALIKLIDFQNPNSCELFLLQVLRKRYISP